MTAIRCPRLRRPNYGEIYPSDCTNSRMPFEGRCAFSCHAGFQLQGPSLRQCVSPGRWNGGNLMTRCVGKHLDFLSVWSWKCSINVWNMKVLLINSQWSYFRCNSTCAKLSGKHYSINRPWITLCNSQHDTATITRYDKLQSHNCNSNLTHHIIDKNNNQPSFNLQITLGLCLQ